MTIKISASTKRVLANAEMEIDDLRFGTPEQNHGQIVTHSYAWCVEHIVRRTHDASDGETSYDCCLLPTLDDDADFSDGAQHDPCRGLAFG